ncbi:hypothetical protein B5X24_HaOG213884 [Helicoverpa armigera]|nr:hypothetical protein B5X24_HaOG213884 [Helicoverpa armigera]
MQSRRSQSANSASSGNTIASNSSKRPRKRKNTEPSTNEPTPRSGVSNVKAQVGDKLKVYYGPTQSESKVTYEAKVIDKSATGDLLRVHYTGWNTRYDEWIKPQRIALNVTQHEQRNKKGSGMSRRVRSKRTEESSARSDTDSDSESDDDVKRPPKKSDDKSSSKTPSRSKDVKSSDSSSSSKPRKRPVRTVSTPTSVSPPKKTRPNAGHQGRDYDLNEIRSELKGLHTVKQEPDDAVKQEGTDKDTTPPSQSNAPPPEPMQQDKQAEDVYEFKEPEPFELELHDEKKKRTHRIFDDISPSKYTSTLSKSLSEEISEDPMRPRPSSLRSPSLSPFRDFVASRDAGRQSPEDDSKDGLFSLDDDSFPGDGSSGPTFEGFTPAKNQETYSKKSKVSKLRELIDDSPDSPADDEQSSDDEPEDIPMKVEVRAPTPVLPVVEEVKSPPTPLKDEPIEPEPELIVKEIVEVKETLKEDTPEPPKTPPPQKKPESPPAKANIQSTANTTITPPSITVTVATTSEHKAETPEKTNKEEPLRILSVAIPILEHKENTLKLKIDKKLDPVPVDPAILKMQPPSSPLIDTEEDKSEPDSPARIDVLPEPPPGFLLQSEGPKIAEKLLKAISSAKRLSMSPPPMEDRPITPKTDTIKPIKLESKLSPISPETKPVKLETIKPLAKTEVAKKVTPDSTDTIFGEPSNLLDVKRDILDVKKAKPEEIVVPRLQSPLNILERRKSVAELPLSVPGKNNKVLSDTIQKLSSQINQSAAAVAATVPLPFPSDERTDSSDSDDSDRRLIIDKLVVDEWGSGGRSPVSAPTPSLGSLGALAAGASAVSAGLTVGAALTVGARALHAGKSPGEWSAGESLLMLEDACKNERKHSASVVVAGGPRESLSVREGREGRETREARDEDGNISLLLCEETIPGSPAPDAEPAPPRQRLHMPFASAPPHQHTKEERRAGAGGAPNPGGQGGAGGSGGGGGAGAAEGGAREAWPRGRALVDNTPPTTPDSSLDLSPPHRERRISERDSPSERKEDEHEGRGNDAAGMDVEKPHAGGRSRKASESSAAGSRHRTRRTRRDTDDAAHLHPSHHTHHSHHHPPLKYNFYVELDPSWDCHTRINVLTSRLADLRKAYHSVKAELAAIDRRRKKLRRKEREAVKAAKAACS